MSKNEPEFENQPGFGGGGCNCCSGSGGGCKVTK